MLTDFSSVFQFEWNWYAMPPFISAAVTIALAIFLYLRTHQRDLVLYLFLFFVVCLSVWSVAEAFHRMTIERNGAIFWASLASFGWLFMAPVFFHFALAFSRFSRIAHNSFVIACLYLPAIIFYILNISTSFLFSHDFTRTAWGWDIPQTSFFTFVVASWIEILAFAAVFLFLGDRFRRENSFFEKRRAMLVILGALPPLVAGTLSQVILPAMGIDMPGLTTLFLPTLPIAIFFAMERYRLFLLTPSLALDAVLATLGDALIVMDTRGRIRFVNQATERLLGMRTSDLEGHDLSLLFPSDTNHYAQFAHEVVRKLMRGEGIENHETVFSGYKGIRLPVSVRADPMRPEEGEFEPTGFILVARDMRTLEEIGEKLRATMLDLRVAKSKLETQMGQSLRQTPSL